MTDFEMFVKLTEKSNMILVERVIKRMNPSCVNGDTTLTHGAFWCITKNDLQNMPFDGVDKVTIVWKMFDFDTILYVFNGDTGELLCEDAFDQSYLRQCKFYDVDTNVVVGREKILSVLNAHGFKFDDVINSNCEIE